MDMEFITDELVLEIFSNIDAFTLLSCARVCKRWLQISNTQFLWKRLVLKRWPSQHWLYSKVEVRHLNWSLIYREFTQYQWYSPDRMKYFTCSSTFENELVAPSLRQAMFEKMESVSTKWMQFDVHDHDGDMVQRYFNQNMELVFNSYFLNWIFTDKRRGYLEELFAFKKRNKQKKEYFIRPYQCVPSCLVMYRWLSMFRSIATVEPGLTFYRIWRFRLKHVESGLVFEFSDWKAAMSSTFLNGQPSIECFLNDALELLQLLTHPHFIMHPLGLHPRIERTFHYAIRASAGGCIFHIPRKKKVRQKRDKNTLTVHAAPVLSNEDIFTNHPDNENYFPDIDEMLEQWRMRRQLALSSSMGLNSDKASSCCSTMTSETEMDSTTDYQEGTTSECDSEFNENESGYLTNCEYFISQSHSFDTVEEQHSLQASVADNWMFTRDKCREKIPILYDVDDDNWYFQLENDLPKFSFYDESCAKIMRLDTEPNIDNAVEKLNLEISENFANPRSVSQSAYFDYNSGVVEPISTALALYRLICLFELNSSMYSSSSDVSVWNTVMRHKKTGGLINFCDYNGMFQVFVSIAEIVQPGDNPREDQEGSSNIDTLTSEFRGAVFQLLNLLMSADFSHPYGTVAGAVA